MAEPSTLDRAQGLPRERETSATHAHHRAHAWCGQGVWVAVPLPCCTAAASCNTAFGTLSSFVGGHHTAWESHANHQHCLCSTLFSAAAAPMLALGPHRPSQQGTQTACCIITGWDLADIGQPTNWASAVVHKLQDLAQLQRDARDTESPHKVTAPLSCPHLARVKGPHSAAHT